MTLMSAIAVAIAERVQVCFAIEIGALGHVEVVDTKTIYVVKIDFTW